MTFTPCFPLPDNEQQIAYREGSLEYEQLAAHLQDREALDIPTVIGGKRLFSEDVEEIRAPHDRSRLLARIHRPTARQVQEAIQNSLACAQGWASMPFADRAAIMHRAASIIAGPERHRINAATMLGQSKTLEEAEPDSGCELVDFLRFNSYNAQRLYQEQPLSTRAAQNRTDWRPLEGFVYAVSPFNFTAIGANLCCGPALMGNVVLWKPSNKSTLSNYIFFEALEAAGLPPGVINFVPGDAQVVTDCVLRSSQFAGLHFTGSSQVFRTLWRNVGQQIDHYRAFPRLVGETGGKDFVLAHASANPDEVAIALIKGAFGYQGQKCSAASRAFIPQSLWPEVRDKIRSILENLKVGDVARPDTYMGAVIDGHAYSRLSRLLDDIKTDKTVELIAGGGCHDDPGYFIEPTVARVSEPGHVLMRDEFFGPVLAVFVYEESRWKETLALIDCGAAYALTGSIFSKDRQPLIEAQQALYHTAGNLYLNDKPTGAMVGQQPFGGGRASGTNDKAGSWMNLLRWTSARVVKETYASDRHW